MQQMRQQLKYLQAELCSRGGAPADEVRVLKERISWLEATNEDLYKELHEYRSKCAFVERCEVDEPDGPIYLMKTDGLERRFQSLDSSDHPMVGSISGEDSKETDEAAKELEHVLLQNTLDKEMNELNKRLEQKESEMKLIGVDTEALKQHFGKKLWNLRKRKEKCRKRGTVYCMR
ncbi:hypothetical protein Fmac_005330 [Flemingia macrophylla]|uniref:Uncharacterized protein n=1 Tax=Flemingia macrophylla TaxID=520843 RepID=A0ABD1NA38_9FABA